ncbi:hypothetical protein [Pseudactinotalea sp. HY158]|uniref:hypothetical protein n=1 Tax=Pseudactinotalea sp. HY158 TaxID=2654547 RepID=UPI00129CA5A6|nr:hypothetical protein [Pseudactinotalea sp. HY158]QGH70776.1 hypothetical protein GCE65_15690 [Pseudactinotalea sp. HY158]
MTSAAATYLAGAERFEPGTPVEWRDLLRSMRLPDYGAPAVFIRYLDQTDYARAGAGMFGELRMLDDCLIGILDGERDLVVIPVESRRLMPWRGAAGDGD